MTLNHDSQESAEHRPSNGARNVNYKQNIHRTVVKDEGGNGAQWHSIPVGGRGEDGGWIRRPVSRVLCPRTAEAARGGDHSSRPPIAERLARPTRTARAGDGPTLTRAKARRPYLVLLQAGLAMPSLSPGPRCALTAPFHPYPPSLRGAPAGGLLSVALSLGSRPAGVTRRLVAVEPGLSSSLLRQRLRRTATARPSDPARTWSAPAAGSTVEAGNLSRVGALSRNDQLAGALRRDGGRL